MWLSPTDTETTETVTVRNSVTGITAAIVIMEIQLPVLETGARRDIRINTSTDVMTTESMTNAIDLSTAIVPLLLLSTIVRCLLLLREDMARCLLHLHHVLLRW